MGLQAAAQVVEKDGEAFDVTKPFVDQGSFLEIDPQEYVAAVQRSEAARSVVA